MIKLALIAVILYDIQLFSNVLGYNDNYLYENVKPQLLKPFVVSTSFGVDPSKDKKKNNNAKAMIEKLEKNSAPEFSSRKHNNDRFYNFLDDSMSNYITTKPISKNSPKIKFYTLNCKSGRRCSAIIPGPTTTPRSTTYRTDEEMREYLKRHGLENGFNYSDDDRVNRNSVVARYFKFDDIENETDSSVRKTKQKQKEKSEDGSNREAKKIGDGRYFNSNKNFWPGYEHKPADRGVPFKSKAKIFKFDQQNKGSHNINKNGYDWDSVQSVAVGGNLNKDFHFAQELPSPSFSNPKPFPYSNKLNNEEHNSKGSWNRFSNSYVSQYNKNHNDWVKISSSNTALGSGYVNVNSRPFTSHKSSSTFSSSKGVGLTVVNRPTSGSSFPNKVDYLPPRRPSSSRPSSHLGSYHSPSHRPTNHFGSYSSQSHRPSSNYGSQSHRPTSSYENVNSHSNRPSSFYNHHNIKPHRPSNYHSNHSFNRPSSSYGSPSYRPPSQFGGHISSHSYNQPPPNRNPSAKSVSFPPLVVLPSKLSHPSLIFEKVVPLKNTSKKQITTPVPALSTTPISSSTPSTKRPVRQIIIHNTPQILPPAPQPAAPSGGDGGGILGNRYAVMAAVGAGLIPASIAALLPIIIGKKRRRRRSPPSGLRDPVLNRLLNQDFHSL